MKRFLSRFASNKGAVIGAVILAFVIVAAALAGIIAPTSPWETVGTPFARPLTESLPLGTDSLGRDIWAGIVHGARVSLLVGIVATAFAVLIGVVVGLLAGYLGGRWDDLLMRATEIVQTIPSFLFAVVLVAIFQPSITSIIVAVAIVSWPPVARLVRGEVLSLREREFVEASRSLGAGKAHIIFKQLLPNLWASILVFATLIMPTYISTEAALSFLGVGVIPPTPTWGNMLGDSVTYAAVDPAYLFIPGTALFMVVLFFNLFGDGLRDALDPKTGRS